MPFPRPSPAIPGGPLRVADFDYDLPTELIAQHPLPRRDESRMMIVERAMGRISHGLFKDFPGHLGPGDLLVLNDVKVIPARVWGESGGAKIEFLFLVEKRPGSWEVLCRPARRLRRGDPVRFRTGLEARVESIGDDGRRVLGFGRADVRSMLREKGYAPLPPYIKRPKEDESRRAADLERYQTVFAGKEAAIAAPTAGLHFTKNILEGIRARGVDVRRVALEVGLATFQQVRVEAVEDHRMLEEAYSIPAATARAVNAAKAEGRPVTAVGTTVVRALESAWKDGQIRTGRRNTDLFIRPGFEFYAVDHLLTNFHLPRSTLLMLVAAFAGHELIMRAYREAVAERYRFFSYGDCMLIL